MKIAYITGTLDSKTGAGRHAASVIAGLKRLGHKVTVVSSDHESFRKSGFGPFKFIALQRYIKAQSVKIPVDAQVLHAHDFYPYALVGYKALKKNQKFFVNGIATELLAKLDKPLIGSRLKKAANKANKIFCISNYTKKRIKEQLPQANNLAVVHLGVEYEKFYQDLKRKDFFNPAKRHPRVLSVGMVKRRKGFDTAIKAMAEVKKDFPGFKYLIVGKDDQTGFTWHLNELVKKLDLADNVEIRGEASEGELIKLYHASDIFLLPAQNIGNHFEGFGLVYLEAGAAGLPAIGTLDNGGEDAIKDGESGFLVNQGDFQAVADKIIHLLKNSKELKSMSASAQERAREFSWEKTVETYEKYYFGE